MNNGGKTLGLWLRRDELNELLSENVRLRAQVQELQEHSTAQVNGQLSRQVRAFHEKYGHPLRSTPQVPPMNEVQFRLRLIAEEFFELLAACEIWPKYYTNEETNAYEDETKEVYASEIILAAIENDFAGTVDLPEFVDALADLAYVIEGGAVVAGVNMAPVLAEVQRANMSKTPVEVDGKQAKPLKPSDWCPPDIAGVLAAQGWDRPVALEAR